MLSRNTPVTKSVESVLRPEESYVIGKICGRGRFEPAAKSTKKNEQSYCSNWFDAYYVSALL